MAKTRYFPAQKSDPITREELIETRRALGMTQSELGEALGVGVLTISRWERGKATVHPQILRLAFEALKSARKASFNSDNTSKLQSGELIVPEPPDPPEVSARKATLRSTLLQIA